MAHYAELDGNNVVLRVIVVDNKDEATPDGTTVESIGIAFCQRLFGGNWIKTSYNGNIRKRYAGIGDTYNKDLDAFVPPQPFPSWTLDAGTANWVPPTPRPNDGKQYYWDEPTQTWIEVS